MSLQQTPALPFNAVRLIVQTMGVADSELIPMLEGTGIDAAQLLADEGHFNWAQLQGIVQAVLSRNPPDSLPLQAGLRGGPAIHGAMGIAAMTSDNLGNALDLFKTYMALRSQIFVVNHEPDHGDYNALTFNFLPPESPVLNFLIQAILASAFSSTQALLGQTLRGAEIHFTFAAPPGTEHFKLAFPGNRVLFGMSGNAILIPKSVVRQKLISSDRQMHALALQQCQAMYEAQLRKGTVSGFVLGKLHEAQINAQSNAPGKSHCKAISLEDMAQHLNLSPRTLLRRLKDEGTTYQQLLDHETSQRAVALMNRPGSTVAQVAEQLGYAEPVTFRRAFRRWFGVSPSEYKQLHH